MADGTKIAWSEATWSPLIGCTKVSAGCDNCYAEGEVNRRHAAGLAVGGKLLEAFPARFDTVTIRPDRFLLLPMTWKRPRRVFVNSLSDLFHKDVPTEFIVRVFAVMACTPQHTYQLLTKRHGRMLSLLSHPGFPGSVTDAIGDLGYSAVHRPFPLSNVHLGVSVEDQARAELRIPALLATPAAVRWISAEPLLGPLDLNLSEPHRLDWVVLGGESGPRARPLDTRWITRVIGEAAGTDTAVFVKQLGSVWAKEHGSKHRAAADPAEWPEQLRVRQYPT